MKQDSIVQKVKKKISIIWMISCRQLILNKEKKLRSDYNFNNKN